MLETAEWLSGRDPMPHSHSCVAASRTTTRRPARLILAQRLQATELLQSTRLPEPWDSRRQARLLDIWQDQGETDKVMAWLAGQPQTADVVKRRAELTQALGRTTRRSRDALGSGTTSKPATLARLNQSTYLALNAGQREHAQQLLERAYDRHAGKLPIGLLQRLAGLYAASTPTPTQQKRMVSLLNRVDPATRGQLPAQLAEKGRAMR